MRGARCKAIRRAFKAQHGRGPAKARVIGREMIAVGALAAVGRYFADLIRGAKTDAAKNRARNAADQPFFRVDFAPSEWRRLKKAWRAQQHTSDGTARP